MISYKLAKQLKKAGYPFEETFDGNNLCRIGDTNDDSICLKHHNNTNTWHKIL